jgi:cytochrome c-type biogenesis protein CcmH
MRVTSVVGTFTATGRTAIDGETGSEVSLQMSSALLGWLLIASSIAVSALLVFVLRSGTARLAVLSRLRSLTWGFGQDRRTATLMVAAALFLLVAGIGAGTSHWGQPEATGSGDSSSSSPSHSGPNGEMLARLKDYTHSVGPEQPASAAAPGKLLPDVNTMIERLAARLETAPNDSKGWRMLGWSYFNTGRYEQAAAAYGRAVALDPNSAELKLSYEEAKAKASSQTETAAKGGDGKGGDGLRAEKVPKSEAMPPGEREAAVRAMVDGLAQRLESSPRDVEGWARLMRSRVVLGEREAAVTALRKALAVFKDDSAASGKITAAAIELGLKVE